MLVSGLNPVIEPSENNGCAEPKRANDMNTAWKKDVGSPSRGAVWRMGDPKLYSILRPWLYLYKV